MRIAIPVEQKKIDGIICPSLGRTQLFLIYNTNNQEERYIVNSATSSQGGAGIKAAQLLVDEKVDAVITMRCGQNAAEVLRLSNIKIYQADGSDVRTNIERCNKNQLEILTNIHAGYHHHGGR